MNANSALTKLKKSSKKLLKNIGKYGKTHPKSIKATKVFRKDREYMRAMAYLGDTRNNPSQSIYETIEHDENGNSQYRYIGGLITE